MRTNMKTNRLLLLILLILITTGGCSAIPSEIHEGETARLRGWVYAEQFYGPPNYGEDPLIDRIETARIMRLNKPITFWNSGEAEMIAEVQIQGGKYDDINRFETLIGTVEHAMTGHDRRAALLDLTAK